MPAEVDLESMLDPAARVDQHLPAKRCGPAPCRSADGSRQPSAARTSSGSAIEERAEQRPQNREHEVHQLGEEDSEQIGPDHRVSPYKSLGNSSFCPLKRRSRGSITRAEAQCWWQSRIRGRAIYLPPIPHIRHFPCRTPCPTAWIDQALRTDPGSVLEFLDHAVQNRNHQHGDDFDGHAPKGGNGHRHHDVGAPAL